MAITFATKMRFVRVLCKNDKKGEGPDDPSPWWVSGRGGITAPEVRGSFFHR